MINTIILSDTKVLRKRKRPKKTSFKAKTSRVSFKDRKVEKDL